MIKYGKFSMDALLVFVVKKDNNIHGTGNLDSAQLVLLRLQVVGGTFPKVSCCRSHGGHLHHNLLPGARLELVGLDFCRVWRTKM